MKTNRTLKQNDYSVLSNIAPYVMPVDDLYADANKKYKGANLLALMPLFVSKDAIVKGFKEGIQTNSSLISKGLVADAIQYLSDKDAKDVNVATAYNNYFYEGDYPFNSISQYIQFYRNEDYKIDNENVKELFRKAIFRNPVSKYKDKLDEVLSAMIAFQNPLMSESTIRGIVNEGYLNSFDSSNSNEEGGNKLGTAGSSASLSPLLIGILILIGLVLIKKIKKA